MCDESTEADNRTFLQNARLTRRHVGVGAGATATLYAMGCASTPSATEAPATATDEVHAETASAAPKSNDIAVRHRMVRIDTDAGTAEGFFVAPAAGAHPGVLVWPDVAGLRPAYEKMATRLAQSGYAVLVVNPYYRSSPLPILTAFDQWRTPEGRAKIAPMREALTPQAIAQDGAAYVAWLDAQAEVSSEKKIATTGYCMGGPFTFRTAAAAPERVGVLASFHGGGLVTDDETSPHRLLPQIKAAALVCVAQNDDAREPEAKTTLKEAAVAAAVDAEVEVYPAQHGWCAIDSPVYDEAQAERAWSRMLATFAAHL